jgi:hypothetical protein
MPRVILSEKQRPDLRGLVETSSRQSFTVNVSCLAFGQTSVFTRGKAKFAGDRRGSGVAPARALTNADR